MTMGALDGIRVIDLGMLVQGPQAAQTLHDLGAEVIKVEIPNVGDQGRWIPISDEDLRAPYHEGNNRGKRSMTLDLRTAHGAEVFLRLVETADIVISNFKAGTLDAWGLGYEVAAARNPRIIYGMGTTFGPNGPGATREGADIAGQAAGGLISTTGTDESGPTPVGFTIADHIGCQNLTIGVLAALAARERTGRGQAVHVSLLGSQIYAQCAEYTAYFLTGVQKRPSNMGHPLLDAAYGMLATADGHIVIVGVPPHQRQAFYAAIDRLDLLEREEFQDYFFKPGVRKLLWSELEPVFAEKTTAEWGEILTAAELRWAPVNDYAAAAADEHCWINGYMQTVDHPEWGETKAVGSPIEMSDTPVVPGKIAPPLGAETEIILMELGYDFDMITEMRKNGAI